MYLPKAKLSKLSLVKVCMAGESRAKQDLGKESLVKQDLAKESLAMRTDLGPARNERHAIKGYAATARGRKRIVCVRQLKVRYHIVQKII